MIEITLDSALQALREVVAEAGEGYIYQRPTPDAIPPQSKPLPAVFDGPICLYVHADGQAGCLIGRALVKLGVPVAALAECQRAGGSTGITSFLPRLVAAGLVGSGGNGYEVRNMLAMAQGVQDAGGTWGEALRVAEERRSHFR